MSSDSVWKSGWIKLTTDKGAEVKVSAFLDLKSVQDTTDKIKTQVSDIELQANTEKFQKQNFIKKSTRKSKTCLLQNWASRL